MQEHVDWLNNPQVTRFSEQRHRQHTLMSQVEYLAAIPDGSYIWLLRLREQILDIGTITAYVDENNKVANMGIMIGNTAAWGHGYGAEAWAAVMAWLFRNGIRKIECGCMEANKAMAKLAAKVGMSPEGMIDNHFLLDGEPQALFLFGKMR